MASGVSATSSLSRPSWSSIRPSWLGRSPRSMSIAANQRMRPPAVRKAGSVMPNARKMRVPVAAKTASRTVMATHARSAVRRRSAAVSFWVMTRYAGTAATGSTMKRTDVNVTRANRAKSLTAPAVKDGRMLQGSVGRRQPRGLSDGPRRGIFPLTMPTVPIPDIRAR